MSIFIANRRLFHRQSRRQFELHCMVRREYLTHVRDATASLFLGTDKLNPTSGTGHNLSTRCARARDAISELRDYLAGNALRSVSIASWYSGSELRAAAVIVSNVSRSRCGSGWLANNADSASVCARSTAVISSSILFSSRAPAERLPSGSRGVGFEFLALN